MAVALFYDSADLTTMQSQLQAVLPTLSGSDKNTCNKMISTLANWQSAPIAPLAYQQGDPDTRLIVVSYTGATKQSIIDFLNRTAAAHPSLALFLQAIADDMRTSAVEPWPPA